jgi:hypothetical protein
MGWASNDTDYLSASWTDQLTASVGCLGDGIMSDDGWSSLRVRV